MLENEPLTDCEQSVKFILGKKNRNSNPARHINEINNWNDQIILSDECHSAWYDICFFLTHNFNTASMSRHLIVPFSMIISSSCANSLQWISEQHEKNRIGWKNIKTGFISRMKAQYLFWFVSKGDCKQYNSGWISMNAECGFYISNSMCSVCGFAQFIRSHILQTSSEWMCQVYILDDRKLAHLHRTFIWLKLTWNAINYSPSHQRISFHSSI